MTGNCLRSALNSPSLNLVKPRFSSSWYLRSVVAIALVMAIAVADDEEVEEEGDTVVEENDFSVVRRTLPSS